MGRSLRSLHWAWVGGSFILGICEGFHKRRGNLDQIMGNEMARNAVRRGKDGWPQKLALNTFQVASKAVSKCAVTSLL